MTGLKRTVRTGSRMSLRADSMLSSALLSELASPGGDLWLISGWITDVEVLDNSQGAFDSILGEDPPSACRLSNILALLARAGTSIHIVTRPDAHNKIFIERLRVGVQDDGRLHIILDPKVHEKTLCGREWILSGSMNFTVSGLGDNEESVTYQVDQSEVAQAHLDFFEKWGVNT